MMRNHLHAEASPAKGRVDNVLSEAENHLARMAPCLVKRRLERAVEIYWSTVDSKRVRTPTGEQLNLLRDHVTEVLKLARDAA